MPNDHSNRTIALAIYPGEDTKVRFYLGGGNCYVTAHLLDGELRLCSNKLIEAGYVRSNDVGGFEGNVLAVTPMTEEF